MNIYIGKTLVIRLKESDLNQVLRRGMEQLIQLSPNPIPPPRPRQLAGF